jgi:hypothetical protein
MKSRNSQEKPSRKQLREQCASRVMEKGDFAPQNRPAKEKTSISTRAFFAEKHGTL